MTPEILAWLAEMTRLHIPTPGRVLEVGARDVNGNPRYLFGHAETYTGTDMEAGDNVDMVVNNHALTETFGAACFDTVLCLENLEHDSAFWVTIGQLQAVLKPGGLLVITTPHFGFPEHRYPKHYVNFGQDAYREWFFDGCTVLDLRLLAANGRADMTVAGIARKPLL